MQHKMTIQKKTSNGVKKTSRWGLHSQKNFLILSHRINKRQKPRGVPIGERLKD